MARCLPPKNPAVRSIVGAVHNFVDSYNKRDSQLLAEVFAPEDIHDPMLVVFGLDVGGPSPSAWVNEGWSRSDSLELRSECYVSAPTAGAEVVISRRNSVLRSAGVESASIDYKMQTAEGRITNFVGGSIQVAMSDKADFCNAFEASFVQRGLAMLSSC